MSWLAPLHPLRPHLVGVALALLAAGAVAPGSAWARCAHYVVVKGGSASDDLPLLKKYGAVDTAGASRANHPTPAAPQDRPGSCSGPSCSRRDGLPPTQGSFGAARAAQWAILAIPSSLAAAGASALLGDESGARPVHVPDAVFHPPRPAPAAG